MATNKLLLIDGNSMMNRGYFAVPKDLVNASGLHTNAILGFLNIFFKVFDEENPTHIAVAFDVHEPTFRHKMFAEYKGTRHGMDPELREQFPVIKEILHKMHIHTVEKGGLEADDLIGSYSRKADDDFQVTILSGDRDLLQLATDKIMVRIPKTKDGQTVVLNYHAEDVVEEYGVTPIEFIEMKGLMGDTSDNIPGVPGIGPKTASKIIQTYHSVENAIANLENITPNKARENLTEFQDQAIFSRDLATIKLDCELEVAVPDLAVSHEEIFSADVYHEFEQVGHHSLLKRLPFEKNEVEDNLEIVTVDNFSELPSGDEYIGMELAQTTDSQIIGVAVCSEGVTYIKSIYGDSDLDELIAYLHSGVHVSFLTFKPYIDQLKITLDDPFLDLQILAYLANASSGKYDFETLSIFYLQREMKSEKELVGKKEITPFSLQDEDYRLLLAEKAYVAEKCSSILVNKCKDLGEWDLYENIEKPLEFVLYELQKTGICCDKFMLEEYGKNCRNRLDELENIIYQAAGEEFNILSTKQLGVILFEKLGLTSGKKTKTGYSTSVEVLEKIKDEHPIVEAILEYRQLQKLLSTYVEGLLSSIKPDGRIHSTFNQTVASTGRLSSADPNLQNIPTRTKLGRELRKAFVPREGWTFVDADYSQIELRVMASISGDENLISAFSEGKDIHAITASKVFNIPLEEVTSDIRRKAKAVNFGIIYGISSFGLGQDLDITREEAKEYIEKYFATYPKIKEYMDQQVEEAKKTGVTKTIYNRIRPIPELQSKNFMQRQFGERAAMNAPIQGTAADIMKIAMIKVANALKEQGLKAKLVLQIHDELLIEAPSEEVEAVKLILMDYMQNAVSLAVPMYIDIHTGKDMYAVK